jgi:plasmid stabilization system protein ParE
MEVEITDWALSCLKSIYTYYLKETSEEKAKEITDQIVQRALSLGYLPNRGRKDDELSVLGKDHRYIIERHYRIIYRVELEKVYVTDIFSNWQDPELKNEREKY